MNKKISKSFFVSFLATLTTLTVASCGESHKYSTEWTHNETAHWHACLTEGHEDTIDNAEHTFSEWAVQTPAGVHVDRVEFRTCTICDYKEERTIENSGTHSYSDKWSFDSKQHWHACTVEGCEAKKDASNHVLAVVDEVPASCMATGVAKHQVCECGALFDLDGNLVDDISHFTLSIDANKHNFSEWIAQVDANCGTETNGTKGHYDCKDCGKHFDANKNEVTDGDLKIAWAHSLSKKFFDSDYHIDYCTVCNKSFDDTKATHTKILNSDDTHHWYSCAVCNSNVIDKTEHTYGNPEVYLEATYTDDGVMLETCTLCGNKKYTEIPMLAAKDRTIAYNGATSKTYDNGYFDLSSSDIVVTTTSTESAVEDIKTGLQYAFYTDAECKTPVGGNGKIIDAGTYYIKITLAATDEWQAASLVVPFEIKPIVVTTFTPGEVLQVKSGNISSDGSFTLGENTSVDGQNVKAVVKLNSYKGEGTYLFTSSMISITDSDGSTTTDYLKNYVVTDNSASATDTITVQVYGELVNSFTLSEVTSVSTDSSSGQTISTFVAKPKLDSGKSVFLTVGGKLLMGDSYVTITKIKIGSNEYAELGTTKMIYSTTSATFTGTVVGLYSKATLAGKTFTLHNHEFSAIGLCVCGESLSIETILHGTESNKEYTLNVYNHKAYYNFNKCSKHTGYFEIRVDGIEASDNPIESVIVYKEDGTSVGEMTFYSTSYYNYKLSDSYNLFTADTQYYVVFTLKESCTYDELTATIGYLGHRYDDSGTCTCGATLS